MSKKPTTTSASLITRNTAHMVKDTVNIYESVAIISRRACQIAGKTKEELNGKLADFASTVDNLEEVHENREQIEISKYYERLPKPTNLATDEFMVDEIRWRYKSDIEDEDQVI